MKLKEMAQKNYARGLWTVEMLDALVSKGKLTPEEKADIVSQLDTEEA